ncbi:MAG: iron-containing alcohol dehydrogenase [Gemmatales bacterium]|nr:iron-containing alcohol dehydrogenase [Gemmatales bacterium]MDW8175969.1 iron-containing alcohol dehydrogenase [Gemmatales bacterium]
MGIVPPPLNNFDYFPTTRVVFGVGALASLGELAGELGATRVLLVTDPGLEAAGHPQRARDALVKAGITVEIFDGVEENPTTRHVEAGVAVAQCFRPDCLVAVGGGSAMDCAKGINFLYTNGGRMQDYRGFGKATKPMLPSIGVPTTAGTGSEAQSYALIADPETHMKMACGDRKAAFRIAILDPVVTITQPRHVTADTGLDALAHAVESYVCTKRNAWSQMLAREAWRLLSSNFLLVLENPQDLEARAAMQLGAHLAGQAIELSMLGAAHALANPLTAHYGVVHGLAVSLMLPHVVRYNTPAVVGLYSQLMEVIGLEVRDTDSAGDLLAVHLENLRLAAGLPARLRELGVNAHILPVLAEEATQQWTGRFNPRPLNYDDFLQLYRAAY